MNIKMKSTCALLAGLWFVLAAGCSQVDPEDVVVPARMLYIQAEAFENQGLFTEALAKYTRITDQYSGSRLATFAHLRMAEIHSTQQSWPEAETNYRLFLKLNSSSHLTPYLLYRLLKVNHEQSYTGVIFREREFDRDMEPNLSIILEYKRFFLMYPRSVYLKEMTPIFRDAQDTLALHELMVADFYFGRGQYNAAISRYQYLLRNFPQFKDTDEVLVKLIRAYGEDQQPTFAEEMRRVRAFRQEGKILPLGGGTQGSSSPPENDAPAEANRSNATTQ
ncbi:MAG: outer membrane protein assembly factor BamD [SAR324 cluster bacterium]|nr:outer membrane protein assembly factor BamD [SAR324 cluster bacterium]